MKTQSTRNNGKVELGRKIGALSGLFAAAVGLGGCVIVEPGPSNYEPYIDELYVDCYWDSYYADYAWDFVAYVDDPNGPLDVTDVFVDVINVRYAPYTVQETWDLVYDGGGQWSQTVYEYYSNSLICEYIYDFEFDFYAYDYAGATDSVTYLP